MRTGAAILGDVQAISTDLDSIAAKTLALAQELEPFVGPLPADQAAAKSWQPDDETLGDLAWMLIDGSQSLGTLARAYRVVVQTVRGEAVDDEDDSPCEGAPHAT